MFVQTFIKYLLQKNKTGNGLTVPRFLSISTQSAYFGDLPRLHKEAIKF